MKILNRPNHATLSVPMPCYSVEVPQSFALLMNQSTLVIVNKENGASHSIQVSELDPKGLFVFTASKSATGNVLMFYARHASRFNPEYTKTIQTNFENIFEGLQNGLSRKMSLVGVGFRVEIVGQELEFKIGFCHSIFYSLPDDVIAMSSAPSELELYGLNLSRLTQVEAIIRNLRPPERYKGKGIRRTDEVMYLKEKKIS
jgi:large subunit ribosomal protein L6